jgi:hypothetical protein
MQEIISLGSFIRREYLQNAVVCEAKEIKLILAKYCAKVLSGMSLLKILSGIEFR